MLKRVDELFLEHPREQGVSYLQHFYISGSIGVSFFIASAQAFVHAVCPYFFQTSSSDWLNVLQDYMKHTYNKNE